jgi:glycosyltransferase involved in cell wall biosynthesis
MGASVIFDSHEFWDEGFPHRVGGLLGRCARWAIRRLLLHVGRRADWVTVVSPPMRDYYNAMRKDGRVDIIYNSPIVESFPLCDQSDRDELLVVHDGIIAANRGFEQMLGALAIARREANVRLKFVGRLKPESETAYRQKVQSLRLQDAVRVTGWLPYEQVGGELAQGQVGMVALQPSPNNYRGLGNKTFNYMCCGLACVVPAGSATAQLVLEADCGLAVDMTRPEEIAGAWVRLARDGGLRRRLGANGRAAIEQRLGWHCMERTLARIFTQVGMEKSWR